MRFERVICPHSDPYHGIEFVERTSQITKSDGGAVRQPVHVTVPQTWSQTATDILADKYCHKAGVPDAVESVGEPGVPLWLQPSRPNSDTDYCREKSAAQVFERMAGCWTYWGWKFGYFTDEESATNFRHELIHTLATQMWAPNSPQWFNTGLNWAYGITGQPSGQFIAIDGVAVPTADSYTRPQVHACYNQGVDDSLLGPGSIMDLWDREARVFKFGGGSGTNFSRLRGKNEPLSRGGMASGPLSWLTIGDATAGAIKSGGTTRRAAKMVILDCDHPDIEEFVNWKVDEEAKVAALVAGSRLIARHVGAIIKVWPDEAAVKAASRLAARDGVPLRVIERVCALCQQAKRERCEVKVYDCEFEGDAYTTVSGQNANNSVNCFDSFMEAVQNDIDWDLTFRTSGKVARTIKARQLFDDIIHAAWSCADPGLYFGDTINKWNTCRNDDVIRSSNPCAEFLFIDENGCNLASINLMKLFDWQNRKINLPVYRQLVRIITTVLDISNSMASYPSPQVAINTAKYRTIGLGYANLGAVLMRHGLPYGSSAGRVLCSALTSLMQSFAAQTSAELASELGAFPRYQANAEHVAYVMASHDDYARGGHVPSLRLPAVHWDKLDRLYPGLTEVIEAASAKAVSMVSQHGLRNAELSCCAPTGTIGMVMDCDTTGIEPDYAVVKFKKLAGGGYFKIVNQQVPAALRLLGYTQEQISAICTYAMGRGTFANCPHSDALRAAVGEEVVSRNESNAASSIDIRMLFGDALKKGLSREQIDAINLHVCGTMGLEGAPHLKDEHLAIFDCATPCGLHGTRSIHPDDHLLMMAAAQPFYSMGISKTINMPNTATMEDVRHAYMMSWQLGLKAVPIYRNGSKLSQILNSRDDEYEEEEQPTLIHKVAYAMARRRILPDRRRGYTQKVRVGGYAVYLRTGEYEDGSLGEIWLDIGKVGSAVSAWVHYFAIAASLALQHGTPLSEFVDAFSFSHSEPNGIVQNHKTIKMATSVLDYVVRELDQTYGSGQATESEPSTIVAEAINEQKMRIAEARAKGYEADPCRNCGALALVASGRCRRCAVCFTSDGCSG